MKVFKIQTDNESSFSESLSPVYNQTEEDNSTLVRDFLIRKYSYKQAMTIGTFSKRVRIL
jgi:hypothetical protein